ncbi:MAG: hypothetical protein NZ571_14425 [Anaerolineae bacterium]|nr:hypothetical protein [Anaerolineae bacterium]
MGLRVSKVLVVLTVIGIALITFSLPAAVTTNAQNPTLTPAIIIVTATPIGGGAPPAVATPTPPSPEATAAPREWQAFNVARAYLSRKINANLRYVTSWTWELMLFPDSALGCPPPPGETVIKGNTAGYQFIIQPLGNPNRYDIRVTYDLQRVYDCGIAGTVPSGGNAPPPAGAATGGGFELGGHVLELNAGTVNAMKQAKMRWVKKQIRPGDGAAFGHIAAAKANGFKILLSVVGKPEDILVPGFFDQYAGFVAELAAAGADAIEVWNEMNLDREWPNGQINPARYVEMLAKAYNAIKARNPNTLVISGAPAPTGAAGPAGKTAAYWNDDVYMQEMAQAGAARYLDCVGVHYNEGIVSPNQTSGDPRDNYPTRYFSTMLNRALAPFPGKQACFTELGYLSPEGYGPLPGGFAWAQNVTVAQQAQWLAEAAVLSARSGRVRLMIVWNVDFPFYGGSDPVAGYAIIRPGGACPACATLGSVVP